MYSVIEAGGLQHKVTLGETLKVPKIDAEVGSEVTISKVLLLANGKEIKVGTPFISEAGIKVEVLSHGKGDKIKVFKKKRRKAYRRTYGHRQLFTEILVKEFFSGSESKVADKKVLKRERARVAALLKFKIQATPASDRAESKKSTKEE